VLRMSCERAHAHAVYVNQLDALVSEGGPSGANHAKATRAPTTCESTHGCGAEDSWREAAANFPAYSRRGHNPLNVPRMRALFTRKSRLGLKQPKPIRTGPRGGLAGRPN
jgi:hypothetical protein